MNLSDSSISNNSVSVPASNGNAIQTKHNLDFNVAESPYNVHGHGHMMFLIGTCEGQWGSTKDSYYIMSVINKTPGNGHLDDVFEWF